MPIFEYRCRDCGTQFEKLVLSSSDGVVCERCESHQLERLLSVFAVSGPTSANGAMESGPCPCGAPRRGMCGE
jgi:putative FmdB family regulatory protein